MEKLCIHDSVVMQIFHIFRVGVQRANSIPISTILPIFLSTKVPILCLLQYLHTKHILFKQLRIVFSSTPSLIYTSIILNLTAYLS